MALFIRVKTAGLVLLSVAASSTVWAVEPTRIELGDYLLEASFDASLKTDDNVYRSQVNQVDSTVLNMTPSLRLLNETASSKLALSYTANYVDYFDIDVETYTSQTLGLAGSYSFSETQALDVDAGYQIGHESIGTGSTEGLTIATVAEATEYNHTTAGLKYRMGRVDQGLSVILGAAIADKQFENFKSLTAGREHETTSFSLNLNYKYSAVTSLFFETTHSNKEYDQTLTSVGFELDNTETLSYVGVEWSVTKNTSGRVGFGTSTKKLDNSTTDETTSSWNASVNWTPTKVDQIVIETSRKPSESSGFGEFLDAETWGLSWARRLSPALSLNVFSSLTDTSFTAQSRDDEVVVYGARIAYDINRRAAMSMSLENEEKDSNLAGFDYDRTVVNLTLSLAL